MQESERVGHRDDRADEIAKQLQLEFVLLVNIKDATRMVLDWKTGPSIVRKLSTLRSMVQSLEGHLSRLRVLSEYGGYMHLVTDSKPHMANEVTASRVVRDRLHTDLEKLIVDLDMVESTDKLAFSRICGNLKDHLDALAEHADKEKALFLRSVYEEEGGSG